MSAAAKIVKSAANAVVGAVETVGKVVVKTVEKAAKVVKLTVDTVSKAVKVVVDVAKPMLENYVVQATLMAAGIPPVYAAPMAAAGTTLARGGTPEDALKSAAMVTASQQVTKSVYDAAIRYGFDPTQAAAAASAASSATQTVIAGGDLEDALKAAGIGAASSYASSTVLKETQNKELANFTRIATTGVLQGQSLEKAIINGVSVTAVNAMQEYFTEQQRVAAEAANIENERNQAVQRYNNAYKDYSYYVDAYNEYAQTGKDPSRKSFVPGSVYANTNNFSLDWYKERIDSSLAQVYALSDEIGFYNQQINDLYAPLQGILDKANQAGADLGSLEDYAQKQVEAEESQLLAQIEEATRGLERYRPDDLMALSPGQVAGLGPIEITGTPRTLYNWEADGSEFQINEDLVVFENGEPLLQLTPEEYDTFALEYGLPQRGMEGAPGEQLPVTGLVDLRDATGGRASGVVLIGTGGGEGEGGIGGGAPGGTGDFTLPFALIGQDAEGNDKMVVGDQTFTLITIGNQKVLKNDFSEVYFLPEVGPTENTPIRLTPVDVQVDEQNQPQVVPKTEPTVGGAQGGQPTQEVFERVTSSAAQTAQRLAQQQEQVRNLLLQQEIMQSQVESAKAEKRRLAEQRESLQLAMAGSITPATTQQAQQALNEIQEAERQLDAYEKQIAEESKAIDAEVKNAEIAIKEAEKAAQSQQKEVEQFLRERQQLVTAAQERRLEEELAQFDRDLARLESEVETATTEADRAAAQRDFIEQQKKRLSQTGRLSGAVQQKIDQELRNFISEFERASGAAATAEEQRRGLTRPTAAQAQERGVTDAEIMRLLGLSKEEVERFGFTPAGEEEGAPVEGEGEGAGVVGEGAGGEGEGVGTGEGGEVGPGTGEGILPDRGVISTVRIGGDRRRPEEGVSTRVTGQGLVGILGDRDPLFGGDPGEQQDVWNVRSLRLRKALGL